MIYTVTTVETDCAFPVIKTTPYASIEKAIEAIKSAINGYGARIDEREKAPVAEMLEVFEEQEYGDLVFPNSEIYINLDCFCSAH